MTTESKQSTFAARVVEWWDNHASHIVSRRAEVVPTSWYDDNRGDGSRQYDFRVIEAIADQQVFVPHDPYNPLPIACTSKDVPPRLEVEISGHGDHFCMHVCAMETTLGGVLVTVTNEG